MNKHTTVISGARALLALVGIAAAWGCGILDTEQPDIIDPATLDSPEGAEARRIGATADFTFARDGDGTQAEDGEILLSGLLADEFVLSTTPPSEQDFDQRRIGEANPGVVTLFLNLHRARVAAERAAAGLEMFSPDPDTDAGIAEMLSFAGFTYIAFGEDFCSGVPFSETDGDELVFGTPLSTSEIFERAIERFDQALLHPGVSGEVTYLAVVGKARALVNLGQFDEAAQLIVAEGVPTDFRFVTEHAQAPLRIQNAIWSYHDGYLWSVSDGEGGTGLPFATADDPRVPVFDTEDVGLDGQTPQFVLLKYEDATAPVAVADGVEARLIEAEALLQLDDYMGMTALLNDLRSTAISPPMPMVAEPASRAEAIELLFSERAYWLFATGHRLGDLRRLVRQYGFASEDVFPTGAYHKGGAYGSDVNIPIPIEEQNNPNATGCINRAP